MFLCFDIMRIVQYSNQSVPREKLVIIRLVHFRAIMCTKRMIVSLPREVGKFDHCTIRMISKHRKISLIDKVYYFTVPRDIEIYMERCHTVMWHPL